MSTREESTETPRQTESHDAPQPRAGENYYGRPLIDPSRIVSPGFAGKVFNPVMMAEFRRWKARPITYIGIVLLVLFCISLPHLSDNFSPSRTINDLMARAFGLEAPNIVAPANQDAWINWRSFTDVLVRLLIRPSTILPLLMVWRALVSFRTAGLYKPFRTTFLTPGEFLWGIIAVPFAVSAIILVFYTGYILGPNLIGGYQRMPPELRGLHPYFHLMMVLFEGAANGILICFIALYAGLKMNARLSALIPIVLVILMIQIPHAILFSSPPFARFIGNAPDWWLSTVAAIEHAALRGILPISQPTIEWIRHAPAGAIAFFTRFWTYFLTGIPKLVLAGFFWYLSTRHLRTRDY